LASLVVNNNHVKSIWWNLICVTCHVYYSNWHLNMLWLLKWSKLSFIVISSWNSAFASPCVACFCLLVWPVLSQSSNLFVWCLSGLLHVSKITRGKFTAVSDLFAVGDKVKVLVVRSLFPEKIALRWVSSWVRILQFQISLSLHFILSASQHNQDLIYKWIPKILSLLIEALLKWIPESGFNPVEL